VTKILSTKACIFSLFYWTKAKVTKFKVTKTLSNEKLCPTKILSDIVLSYKGI